MQLTARVQACGHVEDQTHCVEETSQHEYVGGANVADGEHKDEQRQKQAVAVHQQLHALSDGETSLTKTGISMDRK